MRLTPVLAVLLLAACAAPLPKPDVLKQEVGDTERAFAKTMAQRDHAAFATFLDEETVFFNSKGPLRGKAVVAEDWKQFYAEPQAPFSWEPSTVEVLDSGTLALSSGPVYDPSGKQVASFTSIWRRDASGAWKIIFDKGCGYCPPPGTKKP
ncbi:MAG: YybH family protein [Nevskiaceae bacterium]